MTDSPTATAPTKLDGLSRLVVGAAWFAVAVNVVLMAMRGASAISFSEPLLVITSGAEEDSALAFWKTIHGLPVFEDPHRLPFVASAYNWLYYAFYGKITGAVLAALSLGDAWIPTIGRVISLVLTAVGIGLAYWALRLLAGRRSEVPPAPLAALAAFLFIGPLVGFWAMSLNVELAATLCAIVAMIAVFAWHEHHPGRAVAVACVAAYLAWCFKQSHVFMTGAVVVFLLARREWRLLSLSLMFFGAGWGLAILGGSEPYVKILFFKGTDATLELSTFIRNLVNVATKTTPVAALLAVVLLARRDWRALGRDLFADHKALFSLVTLAVTLPLTMVMSAKQGAAENYYFVAVVAAAFAAVAMLPHLGVTERGRRIWQGLAVAGWLAAAAASATVLAGWNGVLSVRDWDSRHRAEIDCVRDLPPPLLPLSNPYLSLPWLYPHGPHFNLFYNYPRDRAAGRWFERGGVGGLIREGYFGTVLIGPGGEPVFDGASLTEKYRPLRTSCTTLTPYVRKDLAGD
jgi:hypothetical protein